VSITPTSTLQPHPHAEHQKHALLGVFSMFGYFFTHPHARQEKRALGGAFFVFGIFFTLPLPTNSQHVRPSVHFGCSASSSPPLRASTENTPPWACFLSSPSTRHIPSSPGSHEHHHPTLHDEHPNHAHVCVLGVRCLSRLSSCRQLEKCDGCVALFVLAGYAPRQQTPSPNPSPKALIPHLTSLPPFPLLFL